MKKTIVILALALISCGSSSSPSLDIVKDLEASGNISTNISGVHIVKLSGSRHDLGYTHGYYLANEILDLEQNYILKLVEAYATYGIDYNYIRSMVDKITYWDNGSLDELNGILDGINASLPEPQIIPPGEAPRKIDLIDLKVANSLPDWASGPQCSSFAIWGDTRKNGGTLHARNLDYYPGVDETLIKNIILFVFKSSEENRSWISVGWPGIIGCLTCINKEGVSIVMHDVGGEHPSVEKGFLPRELAARNIITSWKNSSDAETLLEEHPTYYAGIFQVAYDGGATAFEIGGNLANPDGGTTVRTPTDTDDYLIVTNHWLKRNNSMDDVFFEDSRNRYDTIMAGLKKEKDGDGEVTIEDAVNILKNVAQNGTGSLTIYSTYFAPKENSLKLSIAKNLRTPAPESEVLNFNLEELFK